MIKRHFSENLTLASRIRPPLLPATGQGIPSTKKGKAGSKPLTGHRYTPLRLPRSRDFVFRLPRPLRSSTPLLPLGRCENQRPSRLSSSSVPSFPLCHYPSLCCAVRIEGPLGKVTRQARSSRKPRLGQESKAQPLFRRQTIRPTINSSPEKGPRTLVASANKDGSRAGWS